VAIAVSQLGVELELRSRNVPRRPDHREQSMLDAAEVTEAHQRALRVIETRLSNLCGDVSAAETTRLLALDLSEVDDPLSLVGAVAAAGAVAIIVAAHGAGVEPAVVLSQIRNVMTRNNGSQ
jgi:hypothetical protein